MAEKTKKDAAAVVSEGKITFANDVIATIAGLAASEVVGLAGMSGGVVEGFAEKLGRKNLTKGIKVEVGTEEVAISINVIVKYGCIIQDVAKEVQAKIKGTIETMTGLTVVEVNVSVLGIEIEKESVAIPDVEPEVVPKLR